ncbi:MAG: CBS domain-containing protein [Pyrinomonadaceae bacterium]
MGDKMVASVNDQAQLRAFTKAVLDDLRALRSMMESGRMETGVYRIGAEQEMFLVDASMRPAPLAMEVIAAAGESRLTTEIGRFNLEANLTVSEFAGSCLSDLERELNELISIVRRAMSQLAGGGVVLCGILPTIQRSDLVEGNLTPSPRYEEMNRVITALHGDDRMVHVKGLDEIGLHLCDTFLEFSNTSFQVHLQPPIEDFVELYNWSQAVAAPVLAVAVNSPLLMGTRLWHETRLALFQQSVDERSPTHHERRRPARVTFGHDWVRGSILDVFHEDVARFRIILTREIDEDPMAAVAAGRVPSLNAWRLHNGTVWRWNRPCYGIFNGRPGLRIEARYLPAGPTVVDEVANAALLLGLLTALPDEYGDVTRRMAFDDAKSNFFSAARSGIRSQIAWLDGRSYSAQELVLNELIPRAEHGLRGRGIETGDIDRYLGVLRERVARGITGAKWMLDSLSRMDPAAKTNVRMRTLTASMMENQQNERPLSEWPPAKIAESSDWIDSYKTVEQFMSRDLFTVRPDDILDLAASIMNWRHVRHVPVEDDSGSLVGIISHRDLIRLFAEERDRSASVVVRDVMHSDLVTVTPETSSLEALHLMRDRKIGCLPVCQNGKLVGILTAHDFLTVSTRLFEECLKEQSTRAADPSAR